MIYLEFYDHAVNMGVAPANLCCAHGSFNELGIFKPSLRRGYWDRMAMANRVYTIQGNTIRDIKNRDGVPSTYFISDEDKLVLMLKAVLL